MKCVCGYEKIGSQIVDGKYGEVDPEKPQFRQLSVVVEESVNRYGYSECVMKSTVFYVCPKCNTLRVDD